MADILLLAALLRILSIVCFIGFSCENTHSLHQIHFFDICKCCLDCSTLSHVCLISIYKKDLMTAPAFFSARITAGIPNFFVSILNSISAHANDAHV